jgi:Glyoxalase-like domain
MHSDLSLSVISHDRLVDAFQHLGTRFTSAFVANKIHPRLGIRNFTLPLQNGHYLEVVCPLDNPSSDSTPFGKAVSQRAAEGGGWLTWVVAVDDVSKIEKRLGRAAVDGHRTKPDGKAIAKIVKVEIAGDESRIEEWLGSELRAAIGSDVEVEWVPTTASDGESGIIAVHVMTPSGVVRLD